ncbi:MAG: DNA repair protein RadA, partial [Bacteroidales bacterium]|nr:DNA repair protein RadA [Bacteroidales bacterium]
MAKSKTLFYCRNCGAQSIKWIGKCPSCGEWNTYVEEVVQRSDDKKKWVEYSKKKDIGKPHLIEDIKHGDQLRINTYNNE